MTEARIVPDRRLRTASQFPVSPRFGDALPGGLPGSGDDDTGVLQTLRTAWAGKWTILLVTALATALAALFVQMATPFYTATARIVLQTEQQTVVDLEGVLSKNPAEQQAMNTELLVLRSRDLMASVVDEMGLENDPEFNPALRPPPLWRRLSGLDAATADAAPSVPPASARVAERRREATVDALRKRVSVSIVPGTYAFQVSVETESAEKSAAIANAVAERYIADQRNEKFSAMEQALAWLSERVVELKDELEGAEASVEQHASGAGAVSEQVLSADTRRLQSMRDRLQAQVEAAEELRGRIARLEALRRAGRFATLSEAVDAPDLQDLARGLAAAPGDADDLARFDAGFARFVEGLRRDVAQLGSQSAAFTKAIAELETEIETQSTDLVALRQLRREAEATRLLYEHFLARMKEISVQQGFQQADSRLLSRAKVSMAASYPEPRRAQLLAGLGGLFLGFGLVLVCDMLRTTFHAPEELEVASGQSVIGVLPEAQMRKPAQLLGEIIEKPSLGFAEATRNLRASIRLSNLDSPPKVVMLTSSVPEEGKSTIASALALTTAMAGARVLLVDGDLRRRKIEEFFDGGRRAGLVSVMSGDASLEDAVFRDQRTGMDVLVAESHRGRTGDFFESNRFELFIGEVRKRYDLVVIDTPPVLVVPDARVIGQCADAIVYVVRWKSTTARMVRTGLELLRQVHLPVTGVALTRIDPGRMDRYGYYGYGHGRRARKFERYYAA